MKPRQGIVEIFSTFVQFEVDQFSAWITDPRAQRSIKKCLQQSSYQKSDTFWALYWYKVWQSKSSSLALAHLSAYLQ